jgi:hypothetical protein
MLLSGEFDSPSVQLNKAFIPLDLDEAKWRIERAAYLSFGPAQYKMVHFFFLFLFFFLRAELTLSSCYSDEQGFAYEYATLGCLFDPLLSVQYYALGSSPSSVPSPPLSFPPSSSSSPQLISPAYQLRKMERSRRIWRSRSGISAVRKETSTRTRFVSFPFRPFRVPPGLFSPSLLPSKCVLTFCCCAGPRRHFRRESRCSSTPFG